MAKGDWFIEIEKKIKIKREMANRFMKQLKKEKLNLKLPTHEDQGSTNQTS